MIPLVSGKPAVDFLELELGWRWSEHSITGSASTYKVAVSYYPTADFQFRASYNKAVRSPAINELYRRQQVQFNGIQDPCTQTGFDGSNPLAPGNLVIVGGAGGGDTYPANTRVSRNVLCNRFAGGGALRLIVKRDKWHRGSRRQQQATK